MSSSFEASRRQPKPVGASRSQQEPAEASRSQPKPAKARQNRATRRRRDASVRRLHSPVDTGRRGVPSGPALAPAPTALTPICQNAGNSCAAWADWKPLSLLGKVLKHHARSACSTKQRRPQKMPEMDCCRARGESAGGLRSTSPRAPVLRSVGARGICRAAALRASRRCLSTTVQHGRARRSVPGAHAWRRSAHARLHDA